MFDERTMDYILQKMLKLEKENIKLEKEILELKKKIQELKDEKLKKDKHIQIE